VTELFLPCYSFTAISFRGRRNQPRHIKLS